MCDQSEDKYCDGEVVWVKLGFCWWPGEVVAPEKLPPDLLSSFRKPPIAVVKFFLEDSYEYVKNTSSIYRYNCSRKTEFIKKGLDTYRNKHGLSMDKFPEDVIRAETATGGDIEILTRDEFQQETKKESYAGLFGGPKKNAGSGKRGKGNKLSHSPVSTPIRKVSPAKSDYKVHILVQKSQPTPSQAFEDISTPSTSCVDFEAPEEKPKPANLTPPTPVASGSYSCHACPFTTSRLNVMILHNKTHSSTFIPYTPSPVKKKSLAKVSTKPTPTTPKVIKVHQPRSEKSEKVKKPSKKRISEEKLDKVDNKKPKTDEEIKSSLLADWDDGDEESNDQSSVIMMAASPEIAIGSESPAVPTPAELPIELGSKEISAESSKSENLLKSEKESPVDSKYEFCEDEDWSLEADVGRKIPRVKNPAKRKEDGKSLDENEVAREVAELLNKTTVPELPTIPDLLKVEENFPEPSIVKSPDKNPVKPPDLNVLQQINTAESQLSKPTIFKTKTFFRSRHSRSQDAIGKYVAEQLNAERLDILEPEINGTEVTSSPEARESPPIEYVKVTRLAPKIQLKKMKAEAAQLQEKVKGNLGFTEHETIAMSVINNRLELPIKVESHTFSSQEQIKSVLEPNDNNLISNINTANMESGDIHDIKHKSENRTLSNENLDPDSSTVNILNTKLELGTNMQYHEEQKNSDGNNSETFVGENELVDDKVNYDKTETQEVIKMLKENAAVPEPNVVMPETSGLDSESTNSYNVTSKPLQLQFTRDMSYPTQEIKPIENENVFVPMKQENKTNRMVGENFSKNIRENVDTDISNKAISKTINLTSEIKSPHLAEEKSYEHSIDSYMNESTASAVDALLSVSRETDKVTKNISDDPPDDLFDDDCRDNGIANINGLNDHLKKENGVHEKELINSKVQPEQAITNQDRFLLDEANHSDMLDYSVTAASKNIIEKGFLKEPVPKNVPTESDLQIAEALINLPSTAIQNSKTSNELQDIETNSALHVDQSQSMEQENLQEEIVHTTDTTMPHDNVCNVEDDNLPLNIDMPCEPPLDTHKDILNVDFETEREKSENLYAAQSLVQMSESIDHSVNVVESDALIEKDICNDTINQNTNIVTNVEQRVKHLPSENNNDTNGKMPKFETRSSKLLKMLEEPTVSKSSFKTTSTQQLLLSGNEKILNFDVGKSSLKAKTPKQKIIIRRTTPNKSLISNLGDVTTSDKIILSCNSKPTQDGSSVQTYTITGPLDSPPESNKIIIQPKLTKISKPPPKLQKIKHSAFVLSTNECKTSVENPTSEESIFDINSMPVVLSDDILTPENIEKMPLVTSDGNIITNPQKLVKINQCTKDVEKIAISALPTKQEIKTYNKPDTKVLNKTDIKCTKKAEIKTLLMNPVSEANKVTTPNILSKSSKSRGGKPMLVFDKSTGKRKIIMTKAEPVIKDLNQVPAKIQPLTQTTGKTEKFIILPSPSSPRPGRTQKIVIDPQSGKAHVLVTKGPEVPISTTENKPVSAKLIPSVSDSTNPGNTVMIITNAQGTQSRIVLTPEHEKILFPNKQQPSVSQLKTITQRITSSGTVQKTVVSTVTAVKPQSKVLPKQKSAIITSKGQLIVGGCIATTAQNISPPVPELRPALKRIAAAEPKKTIQAIQKTTSEPLIFLQQKSGAVMQLTTAQFEHLQRTGQIVQKPPTPVQQKIIVQKSVSIAPHESAMAIVQKQRVKRTAQDSPMPPKKVKQEIPIAPSPAPISPVLTLPKTISPSPVVPVSAAPAVKASYPELDNFEELLPSTAIVRQPETTTVIAPTEPLVAAPPMLADGQLLAIPGENFGGPPGSFYLCIEDSGTLTPIDNRPLVLENNQLVPMAIEPLPLLTPQPERRDILEAALANSDVFHADSPRDDGPDFRDLNANVSVHCRVSETSTTLNQPIMTPIEVPSKVDSEPTTVPSNLEDGLAVIGVTPQTVPTSLELPITVTDPRIAPKTTNPLSSTNYGTTLLTSPNTDMPFVATEETDVPVGPISMPLLTDDESMGKSMPLLTDDIITEKTVSSVDSTIDSPSSIDVRESETEDGGQWSHRRLLTPGSDTSETSAEIPLQPSIQLSISDLSHGS